MNDLTSTQEDYLRAIYLLSNYGQSPVKSIELAHKLSLSKSTVAQRLQELAHKDLIIQEKYQSPTLTPLGLKYAQNLTYKHRIIEEFLVTTLHLTHQEAHQEAHLLEHSFSDKTVKKLAKFLKNPKHCPHGKKIPKFLN